LNINASAAPNGLGIIGNQGANALIGSDFGDSINGLVGNDTLTGGAGADVFRFSSTPNSTSNRDLITDFATASDTLSFSKAIYTGFSGSATVNTSAQFLSGAGVTACNSTTQRFLYDTNSGLLSYDRDGIGSSYSPIQLAVLGLNTHPALAYSDVVLTA
jgi:serralysin